MAAYKNYSTNPMGDYSKRLAKRRKKNSIFGSKKRKKNGCYIATCVYGSYDCPEVWVLRRFRDDKLEQSIAGRIFIAVYYAISPVLVKFFGNVTLIKGIWRIIIDRLVGELYRRGYEDSPYKDL